MESLFPTCELYILKFHQMIIKVISDFIVFSSQRYKYEGCIKNGTCVYVFIYVYTCVYVCI